jgi:hypothetical protein
VTPAYNPSTWEFEAGELGVGGQPGLHSEIPLLKKKCTEKAERNPLKEL